MEQLKEQLQKSIREVSKFDKLENHIDVTVTNEGLRIELTESAVSTFFDSGSARMSADGSDLLKLLAQELGTVGGSRERGEAPDAAERNRRRPGDAGARICGSAIAENGCAAGSIEPADIFDCAISR